jgi:phosphatidylglycerophosphate synthase
LVVALIAAAFSALSGLPYWWAFLILAGAILVNGLVATLEDDLPGGFNNPGGTHTPRYVGVVTWVVRTVEVILGIMILGALLLYFFGSRSDHAS